MPRPLTTPSLISRGEAEAQRSEVMLGGGGESWCWARGQARSPHRCILAGPGSASMGSAQARVGNFLHGREPAELTLLPYAGNCLLCTALASRVHAGHHVCTSLCDVGSVRATSPLPVMSVCSEKTSVKVLRCRGGGLKEHWGTCLGQLRPSSLPLPKDYYNIYIAFSFWSVCNCMF